jgi:hypothetical protein
VKRYLCAALAMLALTVDLSASGNSVVTGSWSSVTIANDLGGADLTVQGTVSVVGLKTGRVTGSVRWIYPEGAAITLLDLVVDEAEFAPDGTAVYLGGMVYIDGVPLRRGVVKLMDNGEGANAPAPDRESYLIPSAIVGWGITHPLARQRLDTPSIYGLTDWFEATSGNIQIHAR